MIFSPLILRLAAVLVAVAALAAAGWYLDNRGYKRGSMERDAVWEKREAEELAKVNVELERLNREARAKEQEQADAIAGIAFEYEQELQDAKRSHDAALARVRAGLKLRDPGTTACQSPGLSPAPQTASGAGRRDAAAGGQLSDQATQFLLSLAADADEIVLQLQACQRVVKADRTGR